MKPEQSASVHRFHNQVSFATESMPDSVYLTPGLARGLALALTRFADSCDSEHFALCPGTVTLDADGAGCPFEVDDDPGGFREEAQAELNFARSKQAGAKGPQEDLSSFLDLPSIFNMLQRMEATQ